MTRFDCQWFEPREASDRKSTLPHRDLTAHYRSAGERREIIGASIWEELLGVLADLSGQARGNIAGRFSGSRSSLCIRCRPVRTTRYALRRPTRRTGGNASTKARGLKSLQSVGWFVSP
jgi:hypothetical protein